MKAQISNDNGRVIIDSDVIAKYAGLTAVECMGVVGMAMVSVKDGLTKLLKRESITKGVSIRIAGEGEIEIDFLRLRIILCTRLSIKLRNLQDSK